MRFGMLPFNASGHPNKWPSGKPSIIQEWREQVKLAEEVGFDTAWVPEHHFGQGTLVNNAPSNPILLSADLAAHTTRIRVGPAGVMLPYWHPLRVAEDIATADHMMGGRLEFGVGRGLLERVSIQFNLDADTRNEERNYALFLESLDIILKAWTEDVFSYKGQFYTLPVPGWIETEPWLFDHLDLRYYKPDREYIAMNVLPKPYQKPHPPVWILGEKRRTFEFAGAHGFGVICLTVNSRDRFRENWTVYKDAASHAQGRDVPCGQNVAVQQHCYVAKTMEEAINGSRQGINEFWNYTSGLKGEWQRRYYLNHGEELTEADLNLDWFDFLFQRDLIWVGTPDYVAEKIAQCRSQRGLEHILLWHQITTLTHEEVMSSLCLFGERVIPQLQNPLHRVEESATIGGYNVRQSGLGQDKARQVG